MVALAAFCGGHRRNPDWGPGEVESVWLEAVLDLRTADMPGASDYHFTNLFLHLAQQYPATLAEMVERTLAGVEDGHVYAALRHGCWEVLSELPVIERHRLWRRFKDNISVRFLLEEHLAGSDIGLIKELLDTGEITPTEAVRFFHGFRARPPVAALAKLLVPKGVEPDQIARLRSFGSRFGEPSKHYRAIASEFRDLALEDDPNVKLVAEAGVRMFSAAREGAYEDERQQTIRGLR